jgi:putative Mg2+ transporter-C (MgtC) family protein
MLISKYGFTDVLVPREVVLDPSRVAAQIVTDVGFLGAGLIFVRRDSVRGLTTAAAIWVTAAIGAAAGSGLPVLAVVSAGIVLVVVLAFPPLARRLSRSATATSVIRVRYPDGRGVLREVLRVAATCGFAVDELSAEGGSPEMADDGPMVRVTLHVHGKGPVSELAAALSEAPRGACRCRRRRERRRTITLPGVPASKLPRPGSRITASLGVWSALPDARGLGAGAQGGLPVTCGRGSVPATCLAG